MSFDQRRSHEIGKVLRQLLAAYASGIVGRRRSRMDTDIYIVLLLVVKNETWIVPIASAQQVVCCSAEIRVHLIQLLKGMGYRLRCAGLVCDA